MKEKTLQFEHLSLPFVIEKNSWHLKLPKSQTNIKDIRQMDLMQQPSEYLCPLTVEEEADAFQFDFQVNSRRKRWKQILKLQRNEKLRLLCNLGKLESYLSTRITVFLHPDNVVFDDNLMPVVVYRGIRGLVPPYEMEESSFLKQYKCFIIALFSKKYDFDQLYNGSLNDVKETDFQRKVSEIDDLEELHAYLLESYEEEQRKTEKTMSVVPTKRFKLFKQLSIGMIVAAVLLAVPVVYYGLLKVPFQDDLLAAHGEYLASSNSGVISTLEDADPEKLPQQTKYILANAYINVENLSESEKEVILKNVSLKSDENYLLYWIYNGRGDFDQALETAKYIDDPQLIMYGLIKKIEQAKNNPDLSGTERDELVNELQDELNRYREEYNLDSDEAGDAIQDNADTEPEEQPASDTQSEQEEQQEQQENDSQEQTENKDE
ncbi:type VII secretion protein EssB [Sediminibacillus dalangtanensis]|uniref:Type VII secretion protein EssB n=1 Tax=Sediminibacillus dalangtanensis TaxID=2729421 RepID=A0ABX7VY88_9BACI|nr:type VII secretion protein EssB [Sediminibacillus dalangtanensis]QTN00544.1 type VII secretion protein EssB [Sediminibacillus dalangtanensis]